MLEHSPCGKFNPQTTNKNNIVVIAMLSTYQIFKKKSNIHQKEIWKTGTGMPIIPELETKTKFEASLAAEQALFSKQQNSKQPKKTTISQRWSTSLACPKPQQPPNQRKQLWPSELFSRRK